MIKIFHTNLFIYFLLLLVILSPQMNVPNITNGQTSDLEINYNTVVSAPVGFQSFIFDSLLMAETVLPPNNPSTVSYTDNRLSDSTLYNYTVEGYRGNIYSDASNTLSVSTSTRAPLTIELVSKPVWRALLLVYQNTDVDYIDSNGSLSHLTTTMSNDELLNALTSFRQIASIAHDFSIGETIIEYDIVYVSKPITTLTSLGDNGYWVSPTDTAIELDLYAPQGKYDSIFIHWMQCDENTNQCIPSYGWGWGMEASSWSNGATYATVACAPEYYWTFPTVGEVWLHEWLHGVAPFYEDHGFLMPEGGADGGELHGYVSSSTDGWAAYYRDLMTGQVIEEGLYTGITSEAWRTGTITGFSSEVYVDYFYSDTLDSYTIVGDSMWNSTSGNISLGGTSSTDNQVYANLSLSQSFITKGRLYIPDTGIGLYDSVSIALTDNQDTYFATLAYGTNLNEKDHFSIMLNDQWGTLFPKTLSPGWYSLEVMVDYEILEMRMKVWADGESEPDWQASCSINSSWIPTKVGFRHYGSGTFVDDLTIYTLGDNVIPPTGSFLTPVSGSTIIKPRGIFSVQTNAYFGVKQVYFYAKYNTGQGVSWHYLGTDTDASDGWGFIWTADGVPDQTIGIKAVIKDLDGNLSNAIIVSNITLASTITSGNGYESRGETPATTETPPAETVEEPLVQISITASTSWSDLRLLHWKYMPD